MSIDNKYIDVYGCPIKETRDALLASANYAEAINGLNGYFTSEPRNDYITIRRQTDSHTFFLYDPEKWADILISWLRTEHGIFYYPGMEAKYAKTERIPPFTERMMDEGALNSLKALYKRVTGKEAEVSSHTIIAHDIICAVGAKESGIEDLKEHITLLEADLKKAKQKEVAVCKDITDYIRQEASRNGFDLPEESDGEPLTIKRVFHDLLELLRKRTAEIRDVNDQRWEDLRDIYKALGCNGMNGHIDDFAKAVKARAEYVESLARNADRETQKSDINKLISDYCNKFDIIAPSPDFSDKACVEYLFSVVDLERKHRAAVGKQMVENYEKDLLQFIYKEYGNRTHLSEETITYNPPNISNTITKIIRDYARNRIRADILEGRIKYIFDKYKTKFTVDDQVINGDPTISFMLDCIWSWIGSSTELKQKCDFLEDELGKEAVIRECLNRRKMNHNKLGTIEKKLEELLKDVKGVLQ